MTVKYHLPAWGFTPYYIDSMGLKGIFAFKKPINSTNEGLSSLRGLSALLSIWSRDTDFLFTSSREKFLYWPVLPDYAIS